MSQEYSRIALTEMDKLLTKLISALKDLDELYRESVTELTENLKGALTGEFCTVDVIAGFG